MRRIGSPLACTLWALVILALFWTGWVGGPWLPLVAALLASVGWIAVGRPGAELATRSRVTALVGAVMAIVFGSFAAMLALLYTSELRSPDPDPRLDGDPCCGYPDTWADVAIGGVYFLVVAFVALAALGAGGILASGAILGRFPAGLRRRERLLGRLGAAAALGAVAVPASWAVQAQLLG